MSSASPLRLPTDVLPSGRADVRTMAVRPVQFVGFWTAVVAPLAYLAVLTSPLDGRSRLLLLTGVFFANVLGLIVGRGYRADS
ncbi:hypothetical protein [Haloarcula salinisoli]|uniref:Uncharacterized protein n=1 Tax=Haloarcula salinisoli TaxID=2487746 RepID=A0A8J7YDC3_9EURY|nr:hypothetical protein [Halomicroarcula salinisoli]MBX0286481.1 hypothetical protein [Halomicroarcula salinisoli]MBX0303830.1 hypothetical protein [Halomicroarcula salinisoli]